MQLNFTSIAINKKKKKLKSHDGIPLKIERKSIVVELKHGIITHVHVNVNPTPHPYSNNLRYFLCSKHYFFFLLKLNNSPMQKKEK